ncbi:hypothetical protein T492DRAFT_1009853 [Pavlovales sp. CCMP2436]|nr:hypothetical protein T492DRAFT_1009853 [Pavlovales sp. CCMP2436]
MADRTGEHDSLHVECVPGLWAYLSPGSGVLLDVVRTVVARHKIELVLKLTDMDRAIEHLKTGQAACFFKSAQDNSFGRCKPSGVAPDVPLLQSILPCAPRGLAGWYQCPPASVVGGFEPLPGMECPFCGVEGISCDWSNPVSMENSVRTFSM